MSACVVGQRNAALPWCLRHLKEKSNSICGFRVLFPNGNNNEVMTSSENLGQRIRKRRKEIGLNQADLELASGTGVRFVSDLENGKETCQLGKFLTVAANLGFELDLQLKG